MIYYPKHSVVPHVDTEGLAKNGTRNVYVVLKFDEDAGSSILCNCSESGGNGANCCMKDCDEDKVDFGGHKEIGKMSIYFMIGRGAFGGPMHALHGLSRERKGIKEAYSGFETKQHTLVLRPV